MNKIAVHGFCCEGFGWHIFGVTADTVYAECGNPDCKNRNVFLEELGEIADLSKRLAEGPPVDKD